MSIIHTITEDILQVCFDRNISELKIDHNILIYSTCLDAENIKADDVALNIEDYLYRNNISKKIIKSFFSILIEGIQNVTIHSDEFYNSQKKIFVIVSHGSDFSNLSLTTGNYIKNENISRFTSNIEYLNGLNEEELKNHYLKVLTNGTHTKKGGAGLGLITLCAKSKQNIQYKFQQADKNYSVLVLKTILNTSNYEKNDTGRNP